MQLIIIALIALNAIGVIYLITRKKTPDNPIHDNGAVTILQTQLDQANERLRFAHEKETELTARLSSKEVELKNALRMADEIRNEVTELQRQFEDRFTNLAQRILDEKSKNMQEQSEKQIKLLIDPLQNNLNDFEKRIKESYNFELQERNSLKEELKRLNENSTKLSSDASNLTQALRSDTKVQGNWGELVLERILERSGLTEGVEYVTQHSTNNNEQDVIRPDVIVNLPGDKHLIIDSKVSLTAYNAWVSAETEDERAAHIKAHITSFRNHVKLLGEKSYPSAKGINAPDFVLLFTPIEAAFALVIQQDRELYNEAWNRQIIIVSPTTLLATMRTVSNIWMQERRIRNVQEIAEEGGKLYDKFVGFMDSMNDIQLRIQGTQNAYDEAMTKLNGKGGIISKTVKMQQLGAKATKQLKSEVIEKANIENEVE